jgi:hypothetical protein
MKTEFLSLAARIRRKWFVVVVGRAASQEIAAAGRCVADLETERFT